MDREHPITALDLQLVKKRALGPNWRELSLGRRVCQGHDVRLAICYEEKVLTTYLGP